MLCMNSYPVSRRGYDEHHQPQQQSTKHGSHDIPTLTPNPPNKSSKQPATNKTKHSKAIMNTEARRDNQNPRPANTRSKEYELDP